AGTPVARGRRPPRPQRRVARGDLTCSAPVRARAGAPGTSAWRALQRDARELFDRREAPGDLRQAVLPERAHACRDRRALDLLAARLLGGEMAELLGHRQQLVDADPALVTRLAAARAAALAVEHEPVGRRGDLL